MCLPVRYEAIMKITVRLKATIVERPHHTPFDKISDVDGTLFA